MTYSQKLKMAMIATNTTQAKLAEMTNQSQQNLSEKISKNNFRLQEFERLVKAMGCDIKISIVLPNGELV